MTRRVHTDADLSGLTLDASKQPDGHARESLFQRSNIDGLTLTGDWRGSAYLGNTGAADWSKAETHASYWRGNKGLAGSKWPADIGHLHHEPVSDIIDAGVAAGLTGELKAIGEEVAVYTLSSYTAASWDTAWDALVKDLSGATKEKFISLMRTACVGYPGLLARVDDLERSLVNGESALWTPKAEPFKATLAWPDGAEVLLDAAKLPPLPDQSPYALARWIEAEADAQQPGPQHYAFVYSIVPMIPRILPEPDYWRAHRWEGY